MHALEVVATIFGAVVGVPLFILYMLARPFADFTEDDWEALRSMGRAIEHGVERFSDWIDDHIPAFDIGEPAQPFDYQELRNRRDT